MTTKLQCRSSLFGLLFLLFITAPYSTTAFVIPNTFSSRQYHHHHHHHAATNVPLGATHPDETTVSQQQQSISNTTATVPKSTGRSTSPSSRKRNNRNRNRNKKTFDNSHLSRAQIDYYKLHQELKKLKKQQRNGAQLAEQRLDKAVRAWKDDDNDTIIITEVTFNIVIMGYAHQARHGDATAPGRAEALLQKLKALEVADINKTIRPTAFSYNAVMQAWSNSRLGVRAYKAILRLLQEMQDDYGFAPTTFTYNLVMESNLRNAEEWYQVMLDDNGNNDTAPDRQTYHLLFKSYGQTGQVAKAEALVEELTERARNGEEELRPHNIWINSVISALAKKSSTDAAAANRADWWLKRMQRLYELGQTNMRPDASTYSQVMNVHAIRGDTGRVEALLQDLEHRYVATGEPDLQPDTVSYTTAIKAYAKEPEQASRLLRVMQDLELAGRANVGPNIVTYNTVIRSWAASRDGLPAAMQILSDMTVSPNSATYAELIFGWSASGLRDAGYRAQQLLQELEALPASKQKGVELTKLYNAVILAWGRSGADEAPRRAEELLSILEVKYSNGDWKACPNAVTFVSVADAYAKACIPDAEERCDQLLGRMEALYKTGLDSLKPNRVLYNTMLNALAKSCQSSAVPKAEEILAKMQASEDCHPDIFTYATIIDCYTKCSPNVGEASDRAEEILGVVEDSYANQEGTTALLEPNAVFYSAMLQAYAKTATPEGAQKAEALLRRNERLYNSGNHTHCKPHAILFNAVIDAVARSGLPDSGQHAEALLQEMEDKYQAGDNSFRVTRRSLNAVLLAYRNDVHGGQKAEYILRRMEELTDAGVYDVMPDVIAWNTAIGAIAHSDDPTAAERAQALLDRMEDLYAIHATKTDVTDVSSPSSPSFAGSSNKKKGNNNKNSNNYKGKQWASFGVVRPDGITYSYVMEAWLRRNDDKGTVMANKLVDKFFTLVKTDDCLVTEPVLEVMKAYRNDTDDGTEEDSVMNIGL